jgi:quercetin dioxygenase-like cupin family protein
MKLVHFDELDFAGRENQHRVGTFIQKMLLVGEPDTPGNFSFRMVRTQTDFFSPRHKHNFDQIRYQLEGSFSFARDGVMHPGTIAYFPEGTLYGPQTSSEESLTVVLQFGGASGGGYMSDDARARGVRELERMGRFEGGIFHRNPGVPGKKNVDGHQAVWEHVMGRPMTFPKPRYGKPVFMEPDAFAWMPSRTEAGVAERSLGTFTERRFQLSFVRLEPGAVHRPRDHSIYFNLSGEGSSERGEWKKYDTVYVEPDETTRISATAASEFLLLGLPALEETPRRSLAA